MEEENTYSGKSNDLRHDGGLSGFQRAVGDSLGTAQNGVCLCGQNSQGGQRSSSVQMTTVMEVLWVVNSSKSNARKESDGQS